MDIFVWVVVNGEDTSGVNGNNDGENLIEYRIERLMEHNTKSKLLTPEHRQWWCTSRETGGASSPRQLLLSHRGIFLPHWYWHYSPQHLPRSVRNPLLLCVPDQYKQQHYTKVFKAFLWWGRSVLAAYIQTTHTYTKVSLSPNTIVIWNIPPALWMRGVSCGSQASSGEGGRLVDTCNTTPKEYKKRKIEYK